jgi:hypothetical protein
MDLYKRVTIRDSDGELLQCHKLAHAGDIVTAIRSATPGVRYAVEEALSPSRSHASDPEMRADLLADCKAATERAEKAERALAEEWKNARAKREYPLKDGSRWDGDDVVDYAGARCAVVPPGGSIDSAVLHVTLDANGAGPLVQDVLAVLSRAGFLDDSGRADELEKEVAEMRERLEQVAKVAGGVKP